MDRCEVYWRYAPDYDDEDEEAEGPLRLLERVRHFVYDHDGANRPDIIAQINKLEQSLIYVEEVEETEEAEPLPTTDKPAPRVMYTVQTIEAACWLAQGSADKERADAILARANYMLLSVWDTEVKFNRTKPNFQKVFWDAVAYRLSHRGAVHSFLVTFDETVNPPSGSGFNVRLDAQPARAATVYQFLLTAPL
jgi:hypothetical protein